MGASYSECKHYDTLVDQLKYFSDTVPHRELMIFYEDTERRPYTAEQLYNLGGRFAWKLHQHGFKRGDVIANTLPNSPERLITDIGIMMAGCAAMNGQILLADGADLFQISRQARSAAIIVTPSSNSPAWQLLKPYISDVTSALTSDLGCEHMPEMKKAIFVTRDETSSLGVQLLKCLQNSQDFYCNPDLSSDDVAVVHCTSGSTGYSKLVDRTHKEVIEGYESNTVYMVQILPSIEGKTYYNDRPLGWIGGFMYVMYFQGDVRILTDQWNFTGSLSAKSIWSMIRAEKLSVAILLPMDIIAILAYLESTDDQDTKAYKLECLITGGHPMFKSQISKYFAITENIINAYGSTEAMIVCGSVISKDIINDLEDYVVGKVKKDLQWRIVNSDGKDCGIGEDGELWLKGVGVFRGYFSRLPDANPKLLHPKTPDGYYKTEDIVSMDSEGNIYVKGRGSDVIMYGSHVLYPGWMEKRISSHPDIQAACVVPVPDPDMFHEICACVKPKDGKTITEEQLRQFCDSLFLTKGDETPNPRYFMILTDDFPQTGTGKIDRKTIKEMAAQRFGIK